MDNQVNQPYGTRTQQPENKCSNCGAALAPGQAFCATCGAAAPAPAPTMPKVNVCNKCGSVIQDGAVFCPTCGNNVSAAAPTPAIDAFNQTVNSKKSNMKKIIIGAVAAIVAVIIVIIIVANIGGSKNFNDMYTDIASESWCEIASDGTWMKLDTNPYNIDDYMNTTAWYKIKSVLTELGFPSSVAEEMNETRAMDGRQSASTDKYEVTWSYHPDIGLEVMFKVK